MSQHRDRSRKKTPSNRQRLTRIAARTVTGETWFTRLPRWVRIPVIVIPVFLIASLAIVALPALVYFGFVKEPTAPEDESKMPGVGAVIGFTLVFLVAALSSGASLIGAVRTGGFCMTPSRYAGLSCITYESAPLLFVTEIVLFRVLFWVCLMSVAASLRYLVGRDEVST